MGCDAYQHRADIERIAVGTAQLDDAARIGARYLDLGLIGLQRAQRLVELNMIADGDSPAR